MSAVPGYSTDRGEKYHVEQPSGSNTLTLSERKKPSGYTGQDGDGSRISNVPIAGFEDDVCLHCNSIVCHCLSISISHYACETLSRIYNQ